MEPRQRLLLPPAGGGGDDRAGTRLRPRHRSRHARGDAAASAGGGLPRPRRAGLVLRERRHPLRHRNVQDARLRRAVGRDAARALRRRRSDAAPLPLRRAGQLPRADRAAAGEQRLPHHARNARRHPVAARPRPGGAAAGLERGSRPAAPVGPAMVDAHAADPGPRDRPARIRRPVRRQPAGGGPRGGFEGGGPPRTRRDRGHGRGGRGDRAHEGAAGRLERPPHRPHRERRDRRGRGQQMDRGRRESADGRWRRNPGGRSGRRGGAVRAPRRLAGAARRRRRRGRAQAAARGRPKRRQRHASLYRGGAGGRHDWRMGGADAAGPRRVPRPDRSLAEPLEPNRGPRRSARRGRRGVGPARAAPQASPRQAGPRRPLQRRRADRIKGPRLRDGHRL